MSEEHDKPQWGEQDEGDGPNLRLDDFVGRIVQDPNAPPSVTLLSGYLGSSSEEGHVRLYLDEELCRYVEIPEKAIRHTQELLPEQSPLGGSLVWIDRDAEVLHGAAGSERRKATFLEGQIAQDYIGGAGGTGASGSGITTQTRDCGGIGLTTQTRDCGAAILPTDMGPGCGQSQYGPCIPPTEQVYCRTLTGIFCTRFGPSCRRTVLEPACTAFGPNCRTVLVNQCISVYLPCVTQNEPRCVASSFVGCNPPIDFTIYEQPGVFQQVGQQQQFGEQAAYGGGAAGAQGFAAAPLPTLICAPTINISCQSRFVAACLTRFPNECQLETAVAARCQSVYIRCPTIFELRCQPTRSGPRCLISQAIICGGVSQFVACGAESAFCGVDPAGGGGVLRERIGVGGAGGFDPTIGVFQTGFNCPSVFDNCATQESFCATQDVTCPSRLVVCQTQFGGCVTRAGCVSTYIRCQTVNFNCPSVAIRCPTRGEPRCFASRTFICPDTRAGCQFESAACGFDPAGGIAAQPLEAQMNITMPTLCDVCAVQTQTPDCAASQASACALPTQTPDCGGRGGAGGGGGGAAFGGAVAAQQTAYYQAQYISRFTPCQSQLFRCQSQLVACPSLYNYKCPTVSGCGYTRLGGCETFGRCPSAVDACPSRFGCYETQVCGGGESIACHPGGGGGGFDPGGFGGGF